MSQSNTHQINPNLIPPPSYREYIQSHPPALIGYNQSPLPSYEAITENPRGRSGTQI